MRISLRKSEGRKLFFTAGNQPTQDAYGLSRKDVEDAFLVSLLLGDHLVLAASYYFESAFTRFLVERYPAIWSAQDERALFFVNPQYWTYTDHGLGKREKSPAKLKAYSNERRVRKHGNELDNLGLLATRDDLPISKLLIDAWIRSCSSSEDGSVGQLLSYNVGSEVAARSVIACISLAQECEHDFVWPAISEAVDRNPNLRRVRHELQRQHADMYAQLMSITLGAVETTPACSKFGTLVSERTVGHLGLFNGVLRRLGIDLLRLRDEQALLNVLALEPLVLLRSIHSDIVAAAVQAQQSAEDYWRAIGLFEDTGASPALTDVEVRQALSDSFDAVGIDPDSKTLERILALERSYSGSFLSMFRGKIENAIDRRRAKLRTPPSITPSADRDVLLFTWADPYGPNCGIGGDREYQKVRSALDSLREKCVIDICVEPALTLDLLRVAAVKYAPRYFHFSGHGSKAGQILLESDTSAGLLSIGALLKALPKLAPHVDCAVFTACHSISASDDLVGSTGYVVLMSEEIDEFEAMAFSAGFYLKLGIGMTVPEAFEAGIGSLHLEAHNASLPRLYCNGVPYEGVNSN